MMLFICGHEKSREIYLFNSEKEREEFMCHFGGTYNLIEMEEEEFIRMIYKTNHDVVIPRKMISSNSN